MLHRNARLFEPSSPDEISRGSHRLKRRPEERVHVLGGAMDLVKSAEVFHFVHGRIAANQKAIIANHNLHSLHLMRQDDEVRALFREADLIEVDSIPLIFWARLVGRSSRRFHRCTYLDWREEFWAHAQESGWRVFFVGGSEDVGERASQNIRARWPGVELATCHGYFDDGPSSEENAAVIEKIKAFRPNVLLVGMGMPRQELWILRNFDRLPPCAMFTVGGAFDYEAGAQVAAPRWMGQFGAEWLFRLLSNPRRMFNRYCVEPWSLLAPAVHDVSLVLRERIWPSKPRMKQRPAYPRPASFDVDHIDLG